MPTRGRLLAVSLGEGGPSLNAVYALFGTSSSSWASCCASVSLLMVGACGCC
jgi:hypothetical protein